VRQARLRRLEPLALIIHIGLIAEEQQPPRPPARQHELHRRRQRLDVGREPARLHFREDGLKLRQRRIGLQRHDHGTVVNRREIDRDEVGAGEGKDAQPIVGTQSPVCVVVPEPGQSPDSRPELAVGHRLEVRKKTAAPAAGRIRHQLAGPRGEGRTLRISFHHDLHDLRETELRPAPRLGDVGSGQRRTEGGIFGFELLDALRDGIVRHLVRDTDRTHDRLTLQTRRHQPAP